MFCPKCGQQLPDGSRFCSACGAQMPSAAQPGAQQALQPQTQLQPQPQPQPYAQPYAAAPVAATAAKKGVSKGLIAGIAVAAVAVVGVGVGLGIHFLGGGTQTPSGPLGACEAAMEDASSFDCDIDMDMDISADGQSVPIDMEMALTYEASPLQLSMCTDISYMGFGASTDMYWLTEGSDVSLYAQVLGSWYRYEITDFDQEELLQQLGQAAVTSYLSCATDVEDLGTEQVDGVSCEKYSFTVDAQTVMEQSGESFSNLGISDTSLDLDGLTCDFVLWVDPSTNYAAKMTFDMSELMEKALSAAGTSADATVTATYTFSNYNNAHVSLPSSAANATDMGSTSLEDLDLSNL